MACDRQDCEGFQAEEETIVAIIPLRRAALV
jgi:hypothetical protein